MCSFRQLSYIIAVIQGNRPDALNTDLFLDRKSLRMAKGEMGISMLCRVLDAPSNKARKNLKIGASCTQEDTVI